MSEERCSALDPARIAAVLGMFRESGGLEAESELGVSGDLGFSRLRIEERSGEAFSASEVSMAGPSNAIEGYVPRRERKVKPKSPKKRGTLPGYLSLMQIRLFQGNEKKLNHGFALHMRNSTSLYFWNCVVLVLNYVKQRK